MCTSNRSQHRRDSLHSVTSLYFRVGLLLVQYMFLFPFRCLTKAPEMRFSKFFLETSEGGICATFLHLCVFCAVKQSGSKPENLVNVLFRAGTPEGDSTLSNHLINTHYTLTGTREGFIKVKMLLHTALIWNHRAKCHISSHLTGLLNGVPSNSIKDKKLKQVLNTNWWIKC